MFWNKKRTWYSEHLAENIQALNEGDLRRIPLIFCVFSGDDTNDKLLAAKVLKKVIKDFGFDDIIRMDLQMRQTTSMEWSINWREQKLDNFFTGSMNVEERQAVLIFASFNPNGFIREKAVWKLSEYDGSLPYIILRQNDWVLQVRQAASESFDKRMQNLSKGEILAALPYAEKLKWSSRGSHGEHTQKFLNKLVSQEHREDLLNGLRSHNIRTRRICISAMFESYQTDIELALNQLKNDPEPFLRKILFEKIRNTGRDMKEPSYIMLKDKFARNRALALQYLFENQAEDIYDISVKALLDTDVYIRTLARSIVKQHISYFNFQAFYLEKIEQFGVPAILGLGETGQADDCRFILKYLDDNRISIVRATLISLMRLNNEKYGKLITEKFSDGRIGVIKTAQKLFIKYDLADFSRVFEIFKETPYEYTKIKCMAILFNASKWERLIYMLEALVAEDDSIKQLELQSIQTWLFSFNRSFAQVKEQQKSKIQMLIEARKDKLSLKTIRELLFLLN